MKARLFTDGGARGNPGPAAFGYVLEAEDGTVLAATLEDWAAPRGEWNFELREGHEFGRANNIEARLLYVSGEQTSTLSFRLDQLDAADDVGEELVLRFEEQDGIAKLARLDANGLHVELFHILTFT